jgi:hypothetical protein
MFGELSNSDDFEDWMRCVVEDENTRSQFFPMKQLGDCPVVFQAGIEKIRRNNKLML